VIVRIVLAGHPQSHEVYGETITIGDVVKRAVDEHQEDLAFRIPTADWEIVDGHGTKINPRMALAKLDLEGSFYVNPPAGRGA
jgi:hypothetical protein